MDRKWAAVIGAVVLIVVLALLAVQCAGDDDDDEDATTTTSEAATSSTESTTTTSEATTTTESTTTTSIEPVVDEVLLAAPGLVVGGDPLDFTASYADAVASVTAVLGAPSDEGDQPECPAGPATYAAWADVGLSLTFQDGAFVGWSARPTATLVTADGIGIGSTVGELRAAHPGTTFITTGLGEEFEADGLFGVATDSTDAGQITDMWAGTTCIFR